MFVVSADLDEMLSLCDRILVIYRGRIVGDFAAAERGRRRRSASLMGGLDRASGRGRRMSAR